ncbi:hypothetical protein K456DRAFT_46150, partial [Colletotrichum gloeosporioides 23]
DQIAQQSAQMTQLLTALNRLISLDRANPMLLVSSILTLSIADTTIQALSDSIIIVFTGRRKDYLAWSQQICDKIHLDVRLIGGTTEV